jgi:hypothetical protein
LNCDRDNTHAAHDYLSVLHEGIHSLLWNNDDIGCLAALHEFDGSTERGEHDREPMPACALELRSKVVHGRFYTEGA